MQAILLSSLTLFNNQIESHLISAATSNTVHFFSLHRNDSQYKYISEKLKTKSIHVENCNIFTMTPSQIISKLTTAKVIIFGGGNGVSFMNRIHKMKLFDSIVKKAQNCLCIGISGGAIAMTPTTLISKCYFTPRNINNYQGLSIVNFEFAPHYEKFQVQIDNYESQLLVIKCNENQAIIVTDSKIKQFNF